MGSESSLWNTVRKNLSKYKALTRHEDIAGAGIPDVSYAPAGSSGFGWIELKHVPDFPKRVNTPVRIKHFTEEQRFFLKDKGERAGYCWVLLQISNEYFLFDHTVIDKLGYVPAYELKTIAVQHWTRTINYSYLSMLLDVDARLYE
jgi:hypothetical protein